MSHLFELRTGYGNRTHIARLRILSTNRYTNPACIFRPENLNFHRLFSFGIAKVDIFSLTPNFSGKFFDFFVILFQEYEEYRQQEAEKAAKWFHCRGCPLKSKVTINVNTVSDMASCITLSCMRLNGPPLPSNPILFAGTWAQYSKKARPHEKRITRISGQLPEIFISWSLRCPYQANVMKIFDVIKRRIVQTAFIYYILGRQR